MFVVHELTGQVLLYRSKDQRSSVVAGDLQKLDGRVETAVRCEIASLNG